MSLFDAFQKANCAARRTVSAEHERPQTVLSTHAFYKPFSECQDRSFAASMYVGRLPHDPVCVQKPPSGEPTPNAYGYDAYKGDFFQDPDRKNTFHNYLTTQFDGAQCANNHQFFENWTRKRTISEHPHIEGVPEFPEVTPMPPLCDVFKALGYSYSNVVGGNC